MFSHVCDGQQVLQTKHLQLQLWTREEVRKTTVKHIKLREEMPKCILNNLLLLLHHPALGTSEVNGSESHTGGGATDTPYNSNDIKIIVKKKKN